MPSQREPAIDVLRGLALLGILLVHTSIFAMPALSPSFSRVMFPAGHDRVADFLVSWLIQGKFYPMFAFLFGWGAFVMASRGGDAFNALYRRRLLALLLVGLLHALLLFEGDILVTYAVLGFFLRRAINRDWPAEKLVRRAITLKLPTEFGTFDLFAYTTPVDAEPHLVVLVVRRQGTGEPPRRLVRVERLQRPAADASQEQRGGGAEGDQELAATISHQEAPADGRAGERD